MSNEAAQASKTEPIYFDMVNSSFTQDVPQIPDDLQILKEEQWNPNSLKEPLQITN